MVLSVFSARKETTNGKNNEVRPCGNENCGRHRLCLCCGVGGHAIRWSCRWSYVYGSCTSREGVCMKKKTKKDAEKVLIQIMSMMGSRPCCSCPGCSTESTLSLEAVHKYFGKRKTREIYKRVLGYKWED